MAKKEESLPTIYYDCIPDSLIGRIWIAASDNGLITIEFDLSEERFLENIHSRVRTKYIKDRNKIIYYLEQINDYLMGNIRNFTLPLDLNQQTPFQRKVLMTIQEIPYGQVSTYAEIAKRIRQPTSYRAVGQALRRNPMPIVIPCHRVVHSDGSLGGYGGTLGSERKITLLKLEGTILA